MKKMIKIKTIRNQNNQKITKYQKIKEFDSSDYLINFSF